MVHPQPKREPMQPLTPKQQRVFEFIAGYIESAGHSPTYEEIAEAIGFRSSGTVSEYVTLLEERGWLFREFNRPRSLRLTDPGTEAVRRVTGGEVPKQARYVSVTALPSLFETWARDWLTKRGSMLPLPGELREHAARRLG